MTRNLHTSIITAAVALLLLATGPANAALTGYWGFDGNFSDGSGNGHTATPHGDASFAPGKFGNAVSLDGSGDWVDVASHIDHQFPQGTSFSATLFFKSPNSDQSNGLLTKGYADNPRDPGGYYLLQVTGSDLVEFDSRKGAGSTPRFRTGAVGPDIADNLWHNATVVRDYGANQFRTYIDGTIVHTKTLNTTDGGDWGMGVNNEAFTIGDHLNRYTTGLFDDVAVFKNQVLTPSQITDIIANGVAATFSLPPLPPAPPVDLDVDFDENSPTQSGFDGFNIPKKDGNFDITQTFGDVHVRTQGNRTRDRGAVGGAGAADSDLLRDWFGSSSGNVFSMELLLPEGEYDITTFHHDDDLDGFGTLPIQGDLSLTDADGLRQFPDLTISVGENPNDISTFDTTFRSDGLTPVSFEWLSHGGNDQFVVNGFTLTQQVAQIPEPATATLAMLGLGGLLMRPRRHAAA